MKLSESYIRNLKRLSGLKIDEVELRATSGRSEKGTLSYYVEDYILNVGEMIIDSLNEKVKGTQVMEMKIEPGSIRISQNSLLMPFRIDDRSNPKNVASTTYSLSISVNLESSSGTVAVLKYGTLNDEFNLQSKHSVKDVSDFVSEIVNRIVNVQKISG